MALFAAAALALLLLLAPAALAAFCSGVRGTQGVLPSCLLLSQHFSSSFLLPKLQNFSGTDPIP